MPLPRASYRGLEGRGEPQCEYHQSWIDRADLTHTRRFLKIVLEACTACRIQSIGKIFATKLPSWEKLSSPSDRKQLDNITYYTPQTPFKLFSLLSVITYPLKWAGH